MSAQPPPYYTLQQYAAMEDEAAYKSEYRAGCIYRIEQVSLRHCAITVNIIAGMGQTLKRTAYPTYASNLRVTVMVALTRMF